MNEIEQAAKEYATLIFDIPKSAPDYMPGATYSKFNEDRYKSFTAGAEFYKNALSQKFEGLREEYFKDCVEKYHTMNDSFKLTPQALWEWFKEKMLK